MPAIDPDHNIFTLLTERTHQQDKEIASLKTQVQELRSSLEAIELRLTNVEDPRTRTK